MNTLMTSNRPYLIRAFYQWIVDNHLTPYLAVNAAYPQVQVPQDYIQEGQIVLNVSPEACRGLHLDNDRIVFSAKFAGLAQQIFIPPKAVMAIYAKENGQGVVFEEEAPDENDLVASESMDNRSSQKKAKKPNLTLIK